MGLPKTRVHQKQKYTYADLEQWPDNERWELIDGNAYNMTPPPSRVHQELSFSLLMKLGNYLQGKSCRVYHAPFGVWFEKKQEDIPDATKYVEPDIVVVCDKNKLTDKGCVGAPDMIIEILSPSTAAKDMTKKLNLYENNHVKEYWIVHPADRIVMVFRLNNGRYGRPDIYSPDEEEVNCIKVGIFDELIIDLNEIF